MELLHKPKTRTVMWSNSTPSGNTQTLSQLNSNSVALLTKAMLCILPIKVWIQPIMEMWHAYWTKFYTSVKINNVMSFAGKLIHFLVNWNNLNSPKTNRAHFLSHVKLRHSKRIWKWKSIWDCKRNREENRAGGLVQQYKTWFSNITAYYSYKGPEFVSRTHTGKFKLKT